MMKIVLIRHGKTLSNLNKTYSGRKDEPLLHDVPDEIAKKNYPNVEAVFVSPLQRARHTAELIYGTQSASVYDGLIERDFGDFEGKRYDDLKDNPDYRAWIDAEGSNECPSGEGGISFRNRCADTFYSIVEKSVTEGYSSIAVVCHGGTIMAILNKITDEKEGFFHWQVPNLLGYIVEYDEKSNEFFVKSQLE